MDIKLKKISKKFPEVLAVNNLNLNINSGELITILGPSGCGKSTILFLIAGLYKPTTGKIFFGDKLVNNIEADKREIGMLFQNYALYPHMTALQNIIFPLKMSKIKGEKAKKMALSMAELTDIKNLLKRKPAQLSGGQQQRVALARALVREPNILLLDEPLSNLDARLKIKMREEIRKIQQKIGITTIMVTHDQEEALSISDKILLLNQGKYQQYDIPRKIYRKPANKFVAKFLGNPPINLLDAVNKGEVVEIVGTNITLNKNNVFNKQNSNSKIVVGIRPEDIILSDNGTIQGKITGIQQMGKEQYITINIAGVKLISVLPWDNNLKLQDKVKLKFKKYHIFDK